MAPIRLLPRNALNLLAQHRAALGRGFILELNTREAERLLVAGEYEAACVARAIRATAKETKVPSALLALTQRLAALAKLRLGDPDGARIRLHEAVDLARTAGSPYEEVWPSRRSV